MTAATPIADPRLPGARAGRDPSRAIKRGPSRLPPEVVSATQRERLFDGLVHTVAEKGYINARVEDICQAAGVTRPAFYAQFAGKEDAFIATYRYGTELLYSVIHAAHYSVEPWRTSVRYGLRALLTTLASVPTFATMAVVEINAVGPIARDERERLLRRFGGFFLDAPRSSIPGLVPLDELITSVVGGLYANIYRHVAAGNVAELPSLLPPLTYFALVPFLGPEAAAAELDHDAGDFKVVCSPPKKRQRQDTQSA
jgi:AcrR family transcriptional regulator